MQVGGGHPRTCLSTSLPATSFLNIKKPGCVIHSVPAFQAHLLPQRLPESPFSIPIPSASFPQ